MAQWLLKQCTRPGMEPQRLFEDEAVDYMAERIATLLQIVHHLTLALEAAFEIGGGPVATEVVESVLVRDFNETEPKLTWHAYGPKAIADLLSIKQAEVRGFPRGQLPSGRANELYAQMQKAGLPI